MELTEGTERILGSLASNLPPGETVRIATETVGMYYSRPIIT